ncbi:MAG: hypothetical protein L0Y56_08870, partial [Nitrospira sp.]|nr:hypothetical protein [Nitrospira sp.]
VDIDPIPVLQTKTTLTVSSLIHKKVIFDRFLAALRDQLAPFYRTTCALCDHEAEMQFLLYRSGGRCSC